MKPPASTPKIRLAGSAPITVLVLLAACTWLVSRVFLGLDFTDEMQYYGEIRGLVASGRLFHNDLFIQQIGYVFLLPFFKLHALIYPDQEYLVLFGRLLLLGCYISTGVIFWRTASRLGQFETEHKLLGLGAFFAWIPFQIFAFSYNSTAYLLIVLLICTWLGRNPGEFKKYAIQASLLLTVLTYTYPLAGLLFILSAVIEATYALTKKAALQLTVMTAISGVAVAVSIYWMHGPTFFADLGDALLFTKGFDVAPAISPPADISGLLLLIALCLFSVWRLLRGHPIIYPRSLAGHQVFRWLPAALFIAISSSLLATIFSGQSWFLPMIIYLSAAAFFASCLESPLSERWQLPGGSIPNKAGVIFLTSALVVLLVILSLGLRTGTGVFALVTFMTLLVLVIIGKGTETSRLPVSFAIIGTVAGTAFSVSSGNGLTNYGIGVAGVIPFLVMVCAKQRFARLSKNSIPKLGLAGLVGLLLINGVRNPYREQLPWHPFAKVEGVPAFKGISTSPAKVGMIKQFLEFSPPKEMREKRLLVIGPHPWLYFTLGGKISTPMFFMHFTGSPRANEVVGKRLSHEVSPDVVILNFNVLPPASISDWIRNWAQEPYIARSLTLNPDLRRKLHQQTDYQSAPAVTFIYRTNTNPDGIKEAR